MLIIITMRNKDIVVVVNDIKVFTATQCRKLSDQKMPRKTFPAPPCTYTLMGYNNTLYQLNTGKKQMLNHWWTSCGYFLDII